METTIFQKIISGELPCYKVYEDSHTLAFLDIHPIQPGQVLIVPKSPAHYVWDLDEVNYQALMLSVRKVANRLREVLIDKKLVAMQIEGLDVAYAHVKLFPFNTDQEYRHQPDMTQPPNNQYLTKMAKKLKF
jgi:histidine triad (HIT) family protein